MTLLRELWSDKVENEEVKYSYQYIIDLGETLEHTCRLAQEQLKGSKSWQKYYNRDTRSRNCTAGNKMLLLLVLPTRHNKLFVTWKGPFEVVEVVNRIDYRIDADGICRTYHPCKHAEYVY